MDTCDPFPSCSMTQPRVISRSALEVIKMFSLLLFAFFSKGRCSSSLFANVFSLDETIKVQGLSEPVMSETSKLYYTSRVVVVVLFRGASLPAITSLPFRIIMLPYLPHRGNIRNVCDFSS